MRRSSSIHILRSKYGDDNPSDNNDKIIELSPVKNRYKSAQREFAEADMSRPPSVDQEGICEIAPKISLRASMLDTTKSKSNTVSLTVSPNLSKTVT